MPLTLTRLDKSPPISIVLRNGQRGTIGRGQEVDLSCIDDPSLAEMHFAVQSDGDAGILMNLAPLAGPLWVNQQQVGQRAVLKHGDRIQAGECLFEVKLSGTKQVPAAKVETTEPLRVRRLLLESQTVRLQVVQGQAWLTEVLQTAGAKQNLFIAANFRAARIPLPAALKPDDDLFAIAPPEVRTGNSLHVWQVANSAAAIEQSQPLWKRDAAMLIVTECSLEELRESHRLHWAWFRAPSALGVQLTRGSVELAKALFKGIRAIVMPAADQSISLYVPVAQAAELHATLMTIRIPITRGT